MAYNPHPNSGVLRVSTTKRNPRAPDYWGDITLAPDLIKYLVECHKVGLEPKLELGGWTKRNDRGEFISVTAGVPRQRNDRQEYATPRPVQVPHQRPQQGYRQQQAPAPNPPQYRQDPEPMVDPFNDEIPW